MTHGIKMGENTSASPNLLAAYRSVPYWTGKEEVQASTISTLREKEQDRRSDVTFMRERSGSRR